MDYIDRNYHIETIRINCGDKYYVFFVIPEYVPFVNSL